MCCAFVVVLSDFEADFRNFARPNIEPLRRRLSVTRHLQFLLCPGILRRLFDAIDKLGAADFLILHILQALRTDLSWMSLQFAFCKELLGDAKDFLCEFEVLWSGREVTTSFGEGFVEDGVHNGGLAFNFLSLRQLLSKDGTILRPRAIRRQSLFADLGRCRQRNGIPHQLQRVVGIFVDVLANVRILVVVDGISTQPLDEVVVVWATCCDDLVSSQFGELDCEGAGCSGTTL